MKLYFDDNGLKKKWTLRKNSTHVFCIRNIFQVKRFIIGTPYLNCIIKYLMRSIYRSRFPQRRVYKQTRVLVDIFTVNERTLIYKNIFYNYIIKNNRNSGKKRQNHRYDNKMILLIILYKTIKNHSGTSWQTTLNPKLFL